MPPNTALRYWRISSSFLRRVAAAFLAAMLRIVFCICPLSHGIRCPRGEKGPETQASAILDDCSNARTAFPCRAVTQIRSKARESRCSRIVQWIGQHVKANGLLQGMSPSRADQADELPGLLGSDFPPAIPQSCERE